MWVAGWVNECVSQRWFLLTKLNQAAFAPIPNLDLLRWHIRNMSHFCDTYASFVSLFVTTLEDLLVSPSLFFSFITSPNTYSSNQFWVIQLHYSSHPENDSDVRERHASQRHKKNVASKCPLSGTLEMYFSVKAVKY